MFNDFQARLPAKRKKSDQSTLSAIFNAASISPLASQALNWARQNDVAFMIDHTCKGITGYYADGMGVVAISKKYTRNMTESIGILTHEIRHAWQDSQNLLPTTKQPFHDHVMNLVLMEADAKSFEKVAAFQMQSSLKARRAPPQDKLWQEFSKWFDSKKPASYGEDAIYKYGTLLGIKVPPADYRHEFNPDEIAPDRESSRFSLIGKAFALNKDFSGAAYFNPDAQTAVLGRILNPQNALRFYQPAEEPSPIVRRICEMQRNGL
jgi:hypothetical protein